MSSPDYDYGPAADRARKLLQSRSRRRSRLWLGVAAVLLVPAVAGLVAWSSYRGAEAKAAARAQELGGRVTWGQGRPERHVIALSFAGTGLQDAQLKAFTPWWWHLPELQDLDLSGTVITDEGLKLVSRARIKNLMLGGTQVTSDGLRSLVGCSSLGSIVLSKTQVDDAGIEHVAALPGLRALYLDGTPITDEALRRLESAASLRYLRLGDNRGITDAGVQRLEETLPELKVTRQRL